MFYGIIQINTFYYTEVDLLSTKESTIIFKSYYDMMELLLQNDSDWREAMTGLLRYGFFSEEPRSDNPVIQAIYIGALPTLKTSKDRYEKAVENGKKGGRKPEIDRNQVFELKAKGYTHQQIADELDCSKDAIKKILQKEGTKGTNLNDNLNDNDNIYANDNTVIEEHKTDNGEISEKKLRELEDLSVEELRELDKLFKLNDRENYSYLKLKKLFHLKCELDKHLSEKIKSIIEHKEANVVKEKIQTQFNNISDSAINTIVEFLRCDKDEVLDYLCAFGVNADYILEWIPVHGETTQKIADSDEYKEYREEQGFDTYFKIVQMMIRNNPLMNG